MLETSVFVRQSSTIFNFNSAESWTILSPIELNIKAKVDALGTPLKDWDIKIYRGILTGYNEAFIIDSKKKNELVGLDPKSAEIIRPILRGRDIKRYSYEFADQWLLFIPWHFPLYNDKTITGSSKKAEETFKFQFPAVYDHLLKFKTELQNRNKEETGIRYEWYALQRWGANYWEDFSKQKICYIEIMTDNPVEGYDFPCFSFDTNNCIVLNTAYIMTGNIDELKYILGILNSKLGRLLVKFYVVQLQQRQFRMLNQYVVNFPIPKMNDIKIFSKIVDSIIYGKKHKTTTKDLEDEMDNLVYQLYDLNLEEIKYIQFLEN
jgi:adenine-specific DNA-methyltransferase